jgi:ABC-2 type transport system ATP-binding protein
MLQINSLTKFYRKKPVLNNLTLSIQTGEIYGLLGANGAGKTTTINCLCGLLKWEQGTIYINGEPLSRRHQSLIGICPQENLLYQSLTCYDNLWFYGRLYGLRKKELQARIKWCLNAVNLLEQCHQAVATLSGGMQRRLNMAVSLIHKPQLLILDEPTTGLDIEARYQMWDFIQELQATGMTILLTTHLLDEAQRLCHTIGILKEGQIVTQGSLEALRNLIPAVEVVTIETEQELEAIALGKELGFSFRYYGKNLAFWLPKMLDLKEILALFEPIKIDSIAKQPVQLEHIYLEVTNPHYGLSN